MSHLKLADPDYFERQRSTLGECLIQLVAVPELPVGPSEEPVSDQQYRDWQDRWAGQQNLITRRLAMIEEELDRLAEERPALPQFGLIGVDSMAEDLDDQLIGVD
jgi:hypothetical protein